MREYFGLLHRFIILLDYKGLLYGLIFKQKYAKLVMPVLLLYMCITNLVKLLE